MTTERIKRIQAGLELPTRDYLTYAAHQENNGQPVPSFEEYIENEQLRQKAAEDARETREAVEDKNFSDRQRTLEPVNYDVYAKQQEAKGLPSPSFEDYIHIEGQKAEQLSEGFGAIPRDYETYAKQREADGDPAPTFEEFIELEELRRLSAREARETADANARQKEFYTSQEYEEGQIDSRQQSIERRSRLNPAELQLEEFASQHAELEHQRMIDGGAEPSFEELRAKKAGQGILLGDEDYKYELENYRRENGLDLADEAQQKAEAQRNAKAKEIIDRRIVKKNWDDVESEIASAEMVKGLYSLTYLDVRGAFYKVQLLDQSGKARGVYAIEEMRDTRDDEMGQLEAPILIYGVETTQNDIVSLLSCLNNTKVIYTFGQSFGNVVVNGEILLGPLGNMTVGERGGVRRLLDFFWTYRVSVYERPITVSINGEAFYMYLTGLRLGKVDPDQHTLGFMLVGTLLDLSREEVKNGATNVNPSSTVNSDSGLERGLTISDRLRPETSQAGPPASAAAADVDALNQEELDATQNTPEELSALQRQVFEADGSAEWGMKPEDRLKKLAREERKVADKNELGKLKAAQRVDDGSQAASERTAARSAKIKEFVAADLKKNPRSTFEDTEDNRRQVLLNHELWKVQDAGGDPYSVKGQADAYTAARKAEPDLFKNRAATDLQEINARSTVPDARPKEEMEFGLLRERAAKYAREKSDSMSVNIQEERAVQKAFYESDKAATVKRLLVLRDRAQAGTYPQASYDRLQKEFLGP